MYCKKRQIVVKYLGINTYYTIKKVKTCKKKKIQKKKKKN